MISIFQHLLERMTTHQSLEESVTEVSRYAKKNFERQWLKFIREHPNIPDEVLKILAQDEDWWIRLRVARREQDLPEDLLRILAQDKDRAIRLAVAGRKQSLPEDVLKTLAQDEDLWIRWTVERRKTESQVNSSPSTRIT